MKRSVWRPHRRHAGWEVISKTPFIGAHVDCSTRSDEVGGWAAAITRLKDNPLREEVLERFCNMIGRGQSETKTTAAKTIKQSKNKAKVFQEFSYSTW
jgi:hypothetical protein